MGTIPHQLHKSASFSAGFPTVTVPAPDANTSWMVDRIGAQIVANNTSAPVYAPLVTLLDGAFGAVAMWSHYLFTTASGADTIDVDGISWLINPGQFFTVNWNLGAVGLIANMNATIDVWAHLVG